jgi:anti-sigma regulatory factor (Ser/Thr protein kinase)
VARLCGHWPQSVLQVAQLLTTEVVTNAVVHGAGAVAFRALCTEHLLRVEVGDTGAGVPKPVKPDSVRRRGGRGLLILAALAADWGVDARDGGKTVWFELRRPGGA